jgi:hypothetical protein
MTLAEEFDLIALAEDDESSSSSSESEVTSILLSDLDSKDGVAEGENTIVRMDMNGSLESLSGATLFAESKSDAKWLPGGSKQISDNEILVADPINKRAFVFDFSRNKVTWVYQSDRAVLDCYVTPSEDILNISLTDGATSHGTHDVVLGTVVVWTNNRSSSTSVYSGTTTSTAFQEDPNLENYGSNFQSATLAVGERFAYIFGIEGEYGWFEYPSIITGSISAHKNRVDSRSRFTILESDGLESPHTGRIVIVDAWGKEKWSWGTNLLVKPTSVQGLVNSKILVSM